MESLVSIIMPVYNSEKFIDEAIQSVLSQTYKNWELIIVDDCSKDNSLQIIQGYVKKDSRIHLYQTDKPSGSPTHPRNVAIEHAQGRYIAFLDSDDAWFPSKLSEQIPLFDNAKIAVVYSNYEKISEEGERTDRVVKAPDYATYSKLLRGNVIGNVTGIYDVSKVGKIFMQKMHHEDYILWLEILKNGFIAKNTNTVLALYRIRKSSVSSNKSKVLKWQWNIYTKVERINPIKASYLFLCYAFNAFKKSRI